MTALKYKDARALYQHHVSSTGQGTYCASVAFRRVLKSLQKKQPSPKMCAQAQHVTSGASKTTDETRLFLQVVRFVCEKPTGTCRDYAKLHFEKQVKQSLLWKAAMTDYRIKKTTTPSQEVTVYLDVDFDAPKRTRHHTLNLKKIESRWVVTNDLTDWYNAIGTP